MRIKVLLYSCVLTFGLLPCAFLAIPCAAMDGTLQQPDLAQTNSSAQQAAQATQQKIQLLQRQSSGDSLEIPTNHSQGGQSLDIPSNRSQGGQTQEIPANPQAENPSQEIPSLRGQLLQPGIARTVITVENEQGRYIADLRRSELEVYVDNQRSPILFFQKDLNIPVSIGLCYWFQHGSQLIHNVPVLGPLLNNLPVLSWPSKLSEAQMENLTEQFGNSLNQRDQVIFIDAPVSSQGSEGSITVNGTTGDIGANNSSCAPIYDYILKAIQDVGSQGRFQRRALLMATDVWDSCGHTSFNNVLSSARNASIVIYIIYRPQLGINMGVNEDKITRLAQETGGRAFILRNSLGLQSLRDSLGAIKEELHAQYTLGVSVLNPGDRRPRPIQIRVSPSSRPNLKVRAPDTVTPEP